MLGQVVTGIGFLGGSVILTRQGLLIGVTSAAVIWVLAAIGAAIGLGQSLAAMCLAVLTVAVLVGVELLESTFHRLRQGINGRDGEPMESESNVASYDIEPRSRRTSPRPEADEERSGPRQRSR